MEFSFELLGMLFAVAVLAGMVDAISGGGSLIVIPVLILTGCTPAQAIGTAKLQGLFGKLSAVLYFRRRRILDVHALRWPILMSLIGASGGALAVHYIDSAVFLRFIPWVLGVLALYLILVPTPKASAVRARISIAVYAITVALLLGFYDGFLGAASGSFIAVSLMLLLGFDIRHATAGTKALLLAGNVSALLVFAAGGHVVWIAGLCMAAGQWIGCHYGAWLVMRQGHRLVRPMLGTVCVLAIVSLSTGPLELWLLVQEWVYKP